MRSVSVNLVAVNPGQYSLALGYLEANLRRAPQLAGRVEVQSIVVDLQDRCGRAPDLTFLLERITRNRPHVIGFSVFLWNHQIVTQLARLLAKLFPQITIVLGGSPFSRPNPMWDEYPEQSIVIMGEGELPLIGVVQCLLDGVPFESVAGVAVKRRGTWNVTPGCGPQDLAELASPILDGTLLYPPGDWLPSYAISRGCRFHCAYCNWGDGKGIRYFPMDRVERELEVLGRTPFQRFWFTDCLFGADEDRYVWLLEKLARWPRRPAFGFETRAESLSPRLIQGFRRVRLDFLAIGIQTLDRKVLANVNRGHDQQRVFEALDRLLPAIREKDRIHLDVILGLPGDSVEGVKRTVDALHDRYPDVSFYFELLKVLPGTPLWDTARGQGWAAHGPEQTHDLVRSDSFTLEEVVQLKALGLGLQFLQRPRVRPHARRLSTGRSYAELALAAGRYLNERGLGAQHEFDRADWLSAHVALRTRQVLREIAGAAHGANDVGVPAPEAAAELTETRV